MSIINKYLSETFDGYKNRPRLECADGFSMSVQASRYHYCRPRVTLDRFGYYDEVEIGFPSAVEDLLMPYVESDDKPLETVYAYVPVKVVDAVIARHGGIKE